MKQSLIIHKQKSFKLVSSLRQISSSSLSSSSQQELNTINKIHELCNSQSPNNNNIDTALQLLDHLRLHGHSPSSSTLSTIIHSLCSSNRFVEAHHRLLLMLSSNWVPNDHIANSLVAHLLNSRSTPHLTLQLINHLVIKNPSFVVSLTNFNRLIDQFCSLSRLGEAQEVLGMMSRRGRRPNVASYTSLINGYVRIGQLDDAQKVFDEMSELGISPNSLTLSVLVKGVLRRRRVGEGKELMLKLWAKMEEEKDDDPFVRNAAFADLIDSLCREGFFHEVFRIAEEMPFVKLVGDVFAYGQMIDSLCRVGKHHGASRIVYIMRKRGFVPSLVLYNSIVHGLSKEKGCMRAYQLFKEGIEFGYLLPEPTYKVIIEGLCNEKDLSKAKDVAEFMLGINGVDKTKIYNIFLSALRLVDNPSEQLNVLVSMLQKQCKPDIITLNTIIHGFCKIGKVIEASKILGDMLKGKFCAPDVVTFTTIIRGFLDVGKHEEALELLHKIMPQRSCSPNVVTYNVVISGLCKLKKAEEAMEIFNEMGVNGISANSTTYAAIIKGLCDMGLLEEAKKFWDDVVWPSKTHDDYVYSAILRGLCNLEKFDAACDFLYELVDCGVGPGIVNYNIVVDAACKLGLKKEAYQIVRELRKNGLKADSVTWRILDKLHFKCSRSLETEIEKSVQKNLGDKSGEIVDNDGECNNEIDPCLSTEVSDKDRMNEETIVKCKIHLDANAIKKESLKPSQKEPLSRIARRVFGVL